MHLLSFCEVLAKKNYFANLLNSYLVRDARKGIALARSVQELLPTDWVPQWGRRRFFQKKIRLPCWCGQNVWLRTNCRYKILWGILALFFFEKTAHSHWSFPGTQPSNTAVDCKWASFVHPRPKLREAVPLTRYFSKLGVIKKYQTYPSFHQNYHFVLRTPVFAPKEPYAVICSQR